MSKMIALKIDGNLEIHAAISGFGDYDTLCSIDCNDPKIGHEGALPLPKGAKIDCAACYAIVRAGRKYRDSDFTKKVREELTR